MLAHRRTIPCLLAFTALAHGQVAPRWVDKETNLERYLPRVAFDPVRDRVVCFGGSDPLRASTRWFEWDGAHWFGVGDLPGAVLGALVADPGRRVVLLVNGGRSWAFDGRAWSEHSNPLPAGWGVGVYDEVRARVVLVWHATATQTVADVWEWNGASYALVPAGTHVSSGTAMAAAWHGGLGRTLQLRASGSSGAEVWGWDGVAWRREVSGDGAPRLNGLGMAYDFHRDRLVCTGMSTVAATFLEVWEWDRRAWTKVDTSGLGARRGYGFAYDAARRECVLFGGYVDGRHEVAETWAFDGRNWALRGEPPLRRIHHAVAADTARRVVVMFGGTAEGFQLADTWEWDGVVWRARTAVGPGPRWAHAMAHDPARGRTTLFGGIGGYQWLDDTWEWDGQVWTLQVPTVRPPARALFALAHDSARGQTVLFGGNGPNAVIFADTWEWDGTRWQARQPTTAPVPGGYFAMAYDEARRRTVLAMTTGARTPIQTWEWDGINWRQVNAVNAPTGHAWVKMAWDPHRARIVFTGASQPGTFEFDGAAWTTRVAVSPNEIRDGAEIAYHAASRRLVAFGGTSDINVGPPSAATWVLGDTLEGIAIAYGTGCGAARVPALARRGRSAPGNARYAIDLLDAAPNAPAALLLAAAQAAIPIGSCTLHVAPAQLLGELTATTSAHGFAAFPLPIPRGPWLIGLSLFAQAAAPDPSAPLGLALTPGLRVPIGD